MYAIMRINISVANPDVTFTENKKKFKSIIEILIQTHWSNQTHWFQRVLNPIFKGRVQWGSYQCVSTSASWGVGGLLRARANEIMTCRGNTSAFPDVCAASSSLAHGAEMKVCVVLCSRKQTEAYVPKILSAFFPITLMTGQIKDFVFNKKLHIPYVLRSHDCKNITTIADSIWIN